MKDKLDEPVLWNLNKALYGLRQVPKLWQNHLRSVLENIGLDIAKCDDNLFLGDGVAAVVHVDDATAVGIDSAV